MSQPWKPHAREGGTGGPLGYRNASNTARRHYGSGDDTHVKSAPKFRIQVWGVFGVLVAFGSRCLEFYEDLLAVPRAVELLAYKVWRTLNP